MIAIWRDEKGGMGVLESIAVYSIYRYSIVYCVDCLVLYITVYTRIMIYMIYLVMYLELSGILESQFFFSITVII